MPDISDTVEKTTEENLPFLTRAGLWGMGISLLTYIAAEPGVNYIMSNLHSEQAMNLSMILESAKNIAPYTGAGSMMLTLFGMSKQEIPEELPTAKRKKYNQYGDPAGEDPFPRRHYDKRPHD